MRKLFVVSLFGLVLLGLPSLANAQGFVLGLGTGLLLGSGGATNQYAGDGNANMLYLMPRVAERIPNPMDIHVVSTEGVQAGCDVAKSRQDFGKLSLGEHFSKTMPLSEKYEVVQVVRTMRPDGAGCLILWFAFIEKDKLVALNELPPLAQNNK